MAEDPIIRRYGPQLSAVSARLGVDGETLMLSVMEADPTKNSEYAPWLLRQCSFQRIQLPEDEGRVREILREFHRIKRIKAASIERDISKFETFNDLEDAVLKLTGIKTNRQQEETVKQDGAETIYEGEKYIVLKMKDGAAAAHYARGTRWCTSSASVAANYIARENGLFIIFEKKEGRWMKIAQFTGGFQQFRDTTDREFALSKELFTVLRVNFARTPAAVGALASHIDAKLLMEMLDDEGFYDYLYLHPEAIPPVAGRLRVRLLRTEGLLLSRLPLAIQYVKELRRTFRNWEWDELLEKISGSTALLAEYAVALGIRLSRDDEDRVMESLPMSVAINYYNTFYYYNRFNRSTAGNGSERFFIRFMMSGSLRDTINTPRVEEGLACFIASGKRRSREFEASLVKYANPKLIMAYIDHVRKARWKEVESILRKDPGVITAYKFKYC